ncbi:NAD-dependent epimerase/dehydratase family protein [Algirhabdus cladophorae]|uniref:NAD-dependent epimerase/dehydratase family protein n=1 Tax=Algirhabdus cladophorae TaxID=3377108 RepID=UPI003B845736
MQILVTGGTGKLAQSMAQSMASGDAPFEMLRLSRRRDDPNCLYWDQAQSSIVPPLARTPDALVHLAGATPVGDQAYDGTIPLAHATLALAQALGIKRMIVVSSIAVYGPPLARPFLEEDQLNPAHPYGQSKRDLEHHMQRNHSAFGVKEISILRLGNVIGADQLGHLAKSATAANPLQIAQFEDGSYAMRSYLNAALLCDVIAQLVSAGSMPSVFNVSTLTPIGMDVVADKLGAPWIARDATPQDVPLVAMDCAALGKFAANRFDLSTKRLL